MIVLNFGKYSQKISMSSDSLVWVKYERILIMKKYWTPFCKRYTVVSYYEGRE